MVANSSVLKFETLKSIASSTVTSSYAALGAASTHPARIIKLLNNSTMDVTISVDGVNDYDYLPAGSFVLYDAGTNRGNSAPELCFPPMQIFVKGTAGTGNLYFVVLYANTPNPTTSGTDF